MSNELDLIAPSAIQCGCIIFEITIDARNSQLKIKQFQLPVFVL